MTLANQISVARIGLIPVFALFAVSYHTSLASDIPREGLRLFAIGTFALASVTDALDGWVARRRGETSALGALLDPIADKALLLVAILLLTFLPWEVGMPVWFAVVVIARDLVIASGYLVLRATGKTPVVRPSWVGKSATMMQMIAILWVMLQITWVEPVIGLAAVLTLGSGVEYLTKATRDCFRKSSS